MLPLRRPLVLLPRLLLWLLRLTGRLRPLSLLPLLPVLLTLLVLLLKLLNWLVCTCCKRKLAGHFIGDAKEVHNARPPTGQVM